MKFLIANGIYWNLNLLRVLLSAKIQQRAREAEIRSAVNGRGFSDGEPGLSVILETYGTPTVMVINSDR
jgi:hypothetical protein